MVIEVLMQKDCIACKLLRQRPLRQKHLWHCLVLGLVCGACLHFENNFREDRVLLYEKEVILEELVNDDVRNVRGIPEQGIPELRHRLREMAALVDLASAYNIALGSQAQKFAGANDENEAEQIRAQLGHLVVGLGGREIVCLKGARPCSLNEMPNTSFDFLEVLADAQPFSYSKGRITAYRPGREEEYYELVEQFDHYLRILRSLPLGTPVNGFVASDYGYRRSPFSRGIRMHEGLDFSIPHGSRVEATADGVVDYVGWNSTYGLVVDVLHNNRLKTRYAHLSQAFVKSGEKLCRGEAIGLVGNTGRSTGPHLHYEIRVEDRAIDPMHMAKLSSVLDSNFSRFE